MGIGGPFGNWKERQPLDWKDWLFGITGIIIMYGLLSLLFWWLGY